MRRTRNAKIVATLGPSTTTKEQISQLFEAGADVFRLNFSHGSYDEHKARYAVIRGLEKDFGRPIGIVMDLQGPKLRVGEFKGGTATLKTGDNFRLDLSDDQGSTRRAHLPHPEIFEVLEKDTELLLDDGKIRLHVEQCGDDFAETRVMTGGELSNHKGVNVPSAVLELSPLTEKDRKDLVVGLDMGVDWVALSFVQRPSDIAEARRLIAGRAGLLAKLEKPSAITHLEEIVELSDAVMVARGDLGVEVPPEDVPSLQKRIILACRQAGKPVIVATQMLDSMIHAPTPTRAEASDVATAVYDGADAVMLSAETAVGEYPVESVDMMERIISRVEKDPLYRKILEAERHEPEATAADAITAAARQVASTIAAATIVTFTDSGSTSLRAARERPEVPILGLTPNAATARRLTLAWGVHALLTGTLRDFHEMADDAARIASRDGFAKAGERLVITAGIPFGTPGATNILRIAWVD
jgi:pyruvate kinase